jgi:probable F420-dependent oxidoreductase
VCSLYPYDRWQSFADLGSAVRRMDTLGYFGVGIPDHIAFPASDANAAIGATWPDNLVLSAYLAGQTERLHFVFYSLVVPYRHPVQLAKQIATLDAVSNGRTQFSLSSGWLQDEFETLGVPFAERGAITDEYVLAMKELWTSDRPTFHGRYVSFEDLVFEPKCVQRPHVPILVGGSGPRPLRRVVEMADGWAPMLGSLDEIGAGIASVRDAVRARGDDPDALEFMFNLVIGSDDQAVREALAHVTGSGGSRTSTAADDVVGQALETVRSYAELGITQVMISFDWTDVDHYIGMLEWLSGAFLAAAR